MVHIPQADPRQHDEHQLDLTDIPHKDPFELFAEWYATAAEQEIADPNAFTLATVDRNNMPDARILLFKGFDQNGLVFYTNTLSTKGQQLSANPQAAAVIHWKSILRQVRIRGEIEPVGTEEADIYFASRGRESQIGAWASQQSSLLPNRQKLEEKFSNFQDKFVDITIPRPDHWSGYRLKPQTIEFWKNGPYRLHIRRQFQRDKNTNNWQSHLLSP